MNGYPSITGTIWRPARRYTVDVVLQSRTPEYGSGRIYPKTTVGHDRIAFLFLGIAKKWGRLPVGLLYQMPHVVRDYFAPELLLGRRCEPRMSEITGVQKCPSCRPGLTV